VLLITSPHLSPSSLARSHIHTHTHVEFWLHHPVIAISERRLNGQILSLFVRCAEHDEIFVCCEMTESWQQSVSGFCALVLLSSLGGSLGHITVDRYTNFANFTQSLVKSLQPRAGICVQISTPNFKSVLKITLKT
jgi:hypothetical protein